MRGDGFATSVARFWRQSYASDYVGFLLLTAGYILIQIFVEPFHRMFYLDNISIQYPHADVERVPVSWLFGYVLGVPIITILVYTLLFSRSPHKVHVSILGLAISFVLTSFITDIIKNAVGRPRPDLLARCKPKAGTPAHELVTFQVCSATDHHELHDGWRSFPSGHSSTAFAGLGYLSLFLAGQLHVLRPRTDLAKSLLAIAPLIGAALIAISRLEDYRHDVYDVTAGSVLGITVAHFSYKRYFPALKGSRCDIPHPIPNELLPKHQTRKTRDEEALSNVEDFEVGDDSGGESDIETVPLARVVHERV